MSDKETPNPYAPPKEYVFADNHPQAGSPFEPGTEPVGLWRQGRLLVMDKSARLPDRCVKSNEPATRRLRRNLYWHHPAIYLTILLHLLIYILLALILRKTATIYVGLSDRYFAKRRRAMLIGWVLAVLSIALIGIGIGNVEPGAGPVPAVLIVSGVFLFLGALLYGLIGSRMVVAKRISDRYVWLKGVHPEFLADLPPWPHHYG